MERLLYRIPAILLISFLTTATFAQNQPDLPVDFDSDTVDYTLTDFGGATSVIGISPTDSTDSVAVTTKANGSETWAGTTIGDGSGLQNPIPFSEGNTKISVMVYAPAAGLPVRLKVEDHNDNTLTAETEATTTAANAWQKLVFDFSTVAAGTNPFNLDTNFDMISIFFNFGVMGNGNVYYWDDVTFGEGAPGSDVTLSELNVDGELIAGFSPEELNYEVILDSGATVVPDVSATPNDTSAKVEIFPADQIPGKTTVLVSDPEGFSRATYSITFKLPAESYPPLSLPINFEDGPYDFIDFDGGSASVITNPDSSGINKSSKVARIIKGEGQPWAGSKLILEENLDFTEENSFSMKVYSPRADVPVLLKIEGPNGAEPDNIVNTTKANEWETLVWNYPDAESGQYDALVFMFDFGTVGDGSADFTFLFDDVVHFYDPEARSQIDLPVTFENETVSYEMSDFGGNVTEMVADPVNPENTVGKSTKTSGSETWAGTTVGTELGFASRIPFTSEDTKMNVMVYSPLAGIPVRIKVEDHNDVTLTAETEAVTTVANEWETLEFDFSTVAEGTNPFNPNTYFDKLSIFFNFDTPGTGEVYYWDNIEFGEIVTSSEFESDHSVPFKTSITGSYPNPFNPTTTIGYDISKAGNVEMTVYNLLGQQVSVLINEYQPSGNYEVRWDATSMSSGVYFVRMITESSVSTLKIMLLK